MQRPEERAVSDLTDYLVVLKSRKWSIIGTTVLAVAVALGITFQQTPIYRATTKLLVQPLPSGPQSISALQPVVPTTEAEIVASEPIAEAVARELEVDETAAVLTEPLEVVGLADTQSISGAQVLQVSYESSDASFAQEASNAFSANYIEHRAEQALALVETARRAIEGRLQEASQEVSDLTAQIDAARKGGDDALATTLELQRNATLTRLGVLQQRLDDIQPSAAVRSGGAQIIESAALPGSPASPDPVKNTGLALFAGLALGIGLAFLRERLDDRFRGKSDLERALSAPVLGSIPRFFERGEKRPIVTIAQPNSPAAESYRSLRTNMQFVTSTRAIKSLLVTSPAPGEGKTTVTANLGVALAQAGKRVILVSSDLRRPTLEEFFPNLGRNVEGLSTWLSSATAEPWDVLRDPGIPNLRVLPSGSSPPNPAELLSTARVSTLVRILEDNCDIVLFDSPPILAVADSAILASHVGGAILVVNAESTGRSASSHAKAQLDRVDGRLIGTVLNGFDSGSSSYYYGRYGYYSSTTPADREGSEMVDSGRSRWRRSRKSVETASKS